MKQSASVDSHKLRQRKRFIGRSINVDGRDRRFVYKTYEWSITNMQLLILIFFSYKQRYVEFNFAINSWQYAVQIKYQRLCGNVHTVLRIFQQFFYSKKSTTFIFNSRKCIFPRIKASWKVWNTLKCYSHNCSLK